MARIKYYYNTETCNYERVEISRWNVFFDLLGFLAVSFVIAIVILWGYTTYFDLPKVVQLKQENTLLKHHYDQIQREIEQSHQVLAHLQEQDDNLYRMILEAEPVPLAVRKAGVGGTERYEELFKTNELIANTVQKVDQLKRQLYIQSKSYNEITKRAKNKEKMLACIPAIQPISHKDFKRISSPFGYRPDPFTRLPHFHSGLDIAARKGTPIYAPGDGVVKLAKKGFSGGYGNYVLIAHGYGFTTRYCHMQDFTVTSGQKVRRGQCIGYVGSTGRSTGPHLHYEVRKNNKLVNPAHYFLNDLNAAEYERALELASRKIKVPQ
ncbi:MAG: M23 family metallopeptidase [Bacteroidota bacterium]